MHVKARHNSHQITVISINNIILQLKLPKKTISVSTLAWFIIPRLFSMHHRLSYLPKLTVARTSYLGIQNECPYQSKDE